MIRRDDETLRETRSRVTVRQVYKRKDAFYARAKTTGYRSRAAFKLLELAERGRLFRPGDRVVDLGAWPGGWLQVVAQCVGPSGRVVGIDRQPIAPLPERTVNTLVGDVTDARTRQDALELCGGKADVILSDLAPKLSGIRARDQAEAQRLADCVIDCVTQLLKPNGKLVVKLFAGPDLARYVARLRGLFRHAHLNRPQATRKGSAEIYILASGFHGFKGAEATE